MEYTKDGVVQRKLSQLESLIYPEKEDLPEWETWQGEYSGYGEYSGIEQEHTQIRVSEHWICKDHLTRWFRRSVKIPEHFDGKPVVLLLEFGGEGLVRINGSIRSAITSYLRPSDATRTRVLVSEHARGGETLDVEIEAGMNYMEFNQFRRTGKTEIEYTIRTAQIALLDREAEACFFDLRTAFLALQQLRCPTESLSHSALRLVGPLSEVVENSEKDSYLSHKLEDALADALSRIPFDFSKEEIRNSLPEAQAVLSAKLKKLPSSAHAMITFVGQAHIDTAWLWTIRESVRKTGKTFSNVLSLMDQYPEFVFAFSQPQLFEFAKDHYPELYAKVKEKVKSGQFELVGNTWVEMDANIPSGESLVRQLLYGREFFRKEFGKVSDVFWMPDVFGYSWALPQIIKRSGMKYFYTSKLCNNDTNRFPHSLFQWQGIDGTRVLSYLQRLNYNGDYSPKAADTIYRRFDQKHLTENIMMTYGFGDGGGGPSYQMIETGKRLQSFPGLQNTRFGTSESFFQSCETDMEKLPVWNDEMYFEFHRGTYSSQAHTKRANRKNEQLYRRAEIASSMAACLAGSSYPYEAFLRGYKKLLTNQFHDILPGSSIQPVYRIAELDYKEIEENGRSLLDSGRRHLTDRIPHQPGDIIVFNSLSWDCTQTVRVPVENLPSTPIRIFALPSKKAVTGFPVEIDGAYYLEFTAENVPAMGYQVFRPEYGIPAKATGNLLSEDRVLENEFLRAELDENGYFRSIFDKEARREVLEHTEHPSCLKIFEDKPANETAWNIDLEYQNKEWILLRPESIEIVENTPDRAVIRVKRSFHLSSIEQDIIFTRGSRHIDFHTKVDWQETEKMLKAEFLVDILSSRAAYEIQFGAIERPTHWNTSYDRARFEVCGHKWADLSEADYGVSLMNDCKYGYDIKENRMRLTLLRAAVDPDLQADKGTHEFTYSLFLHQNDWRHAGTVNAAYELNMPLEGTLLSDASDGPLPTRFSFASSSDANVIIDTVKMAEDGRGVILRVYEAAGKKTNAHLSVSQEDFRAVECNLMEEDEKQLASDPYGFDFTIRPFEIKTFRIC